jgi:hypothetical protein
MVGRLGWWSTILSVARDVGQGWETRRDATKEGFGTTPKSSRALLVTRVLGVPSVLADTIIQSS